MGDLSHGQQTTVMKKCRVHGKLDKGQLSCPECKWLREHFDAIEALDNLQKKENEGRGISCVKAIVTYMLRGQFDLAAAVRKTEGDKTRNYPKVEEQLLSMFGCRLHGEKECKR